MLGKAVEMHYGIIGNCKTAALVHKSGRIEWCCLPKFDSPSVFASILDPEGGYFEVRLSGTHSVRQNYIPKTNILYTEFDDGQNAFATIDFMPRYREGTIFKKPLEIHRFLKPLRGQPTIRISFKPRLNYAQKETKVKLRPNSITASNGLESIYLYSSLSLISLMEGTSLSLQEENYLLLTYHEKLELPDLSYVREMFEKTKKYWEGWSGHCRLPSLFSDEVLRSALTLKLLTYEETGALIAAATTSLPEVLGNERNWDYRYCWLRDSSLVLEALKSMGHFEEARGFIHFLLRIFESKQTKVQILYGIGGRSNLEEKILPHLRGYKDSGPVRIGNNAWHTRQNDIFGEILNTIYLYYFHHQIEKMPEEVWSLVKFLVHTIAQDWFTPDAGIWEIRHRKEHFTFSKVLSWVALDRGIKIAEKIGKHYAVENWRPFALEIRKDIESKGWNEEIGSFTQVYGSADVDASLLLMEHYGFLTSQDPRWIGTVKQCEKQLMQNGYVFRYKNEDDFGKPKNAFIVAAFWMVNALYSIGESKKALKLFEGTLAKANHLGLFSEDFDVKTGELLGNFPQAYSHMALINTVNMLSQG